MAIVESTFSGNTADFGGGIWNSGTATLTNGTVSGNLASWGGGIGERQQRNVDVGKQHPSG